MWDTEYIEDYKMNKYLNDEMYIEDKKAMEEYYEWEQQEAMKEQEILEKDLEIERAGFTYNTLLYEMYWY